MAEDPKQNDPKPDSPAEEESPILSNTDRASLEEIIAQKRAELKKSAPGGKPSSKKKSDKEDPDEETATETPAPDPAEAADPGKEDTEEWARKQLAAFDKGDSEESSGSEKSGGQAAADQPAADEVAAAADEWAAQQLAAFDEADRRKAEQQAKQAGQTPEAASPEAAGEGESLQDVIARQRAALLKKMGSPDEGGRTEDTPAEPADEPADAAASPGTESARAEPQRVPRREASVQATTGRRGRLIPMLLAANTLMVLLLAGLVVTQILPRPGTTTASMSRTATSMPVELREPTDVPEPTSRPRQVLAQSMPSYADIPEVSEPQRVQAEKAYAEQRYRAALALFEPLYRQAAARPADDLLRDLLAVRVAGCLRHLDQTMDARTLLVASADSRSPLVAAVARRDLAALDAEEGRAMVARNRAYSALGLLGAVEHSTEALAADCEYVIARSLSEMVLSFVGESSEVDWSHALESDPFAGHAGADLRRLLGDGVSRLAQARLSPQVRRGKGGESAVGWDVTWSGPTLQELLQQLASKSGMDVRWESGEQYARYREVTVICRGASEHRVAATACGMSGLVARLTGNEIVVYDPRENDSMKLRKELVGREAVSLWRRFFLRAIEDQRVAEGHYILGRVHEAEGEPLEALRAYQLISGRYWRHKIAAPALLRSARLRIDMRDHRGAGKDLVELLDRYPNSALIGEAYLSWGEATRHSGRREEAARIYEKLYYFENVDGRLRSQACVRAAECYFEGEDYAAAAKWATRALGLMKGMQGEQVAQAYLLLGRSSAGAGDLDEAALAFQQALAVEPGYRQRVEALLGLVPVQVRRERFVQAVGTLERLRNEELDEPDRARFLAMSSRTYRAMGLPHRAVITLRNEIVFIESPELRAELRTELARAEAQTDRLDAARDSLALYLAKAEPGEPAYEAQVELAEVSLRMDDLAEAISIADQLLRSDCGDVVRGRAARVLGTAYVRQGEYEKAAEALSLLASAPSTEASDE